MSRVILVTGGAGYIGSRFIRNLALDPTFADCKIRIYDNLQRESYNALLDLPDEGRYEFIEGDVLDNFGVRRVLQDVWAIVHLAAVVRTPLSFGPKGWIEQVNHWGTGNLVEAALAANVEVFIYSSSASVYGPISQNMVSQPFREMDICRPVGLYAESKLRAEAQIERLSQQTSMKTVVLRLGTIYGLAPAMRFDGVANRFSYLAGIKRPMTVFGDGQQQRPQLHVDDASSALSFALRQVDEMRGGIYNVVGENTSVLSLAQAVQSARPQAEIRYTEQDVMVHFSYVIDGAKLNNLGWYPQVSIEAGISDMLVHLRGFS